MTTMLRSAAMTLLSKTLLTFLYKYLSDVDVEGVEMPSLYGTAESAGGSGWGVRLSNVKLREGAELMAVLPGTRKAASAKEKPKSSSSSLKGGGGEESVINDDDDEGVDVNSTVSSRIKGPAKDAPKDTEEMPIKQHGTKRSQGATRSGDGTAAKQNGTDESGATIDANQQQQQNSKTNDNTKKGGVTLLGSSVNTSSTGLAEETLLTEELEELGLQSDCGSLASLDDLEASGRPETPTQQSSMSFLSCFGPSGQDTTSNKTSNDTSNKPTTTNSSNGRGTTMTTEKREQDANLSSETPSQEEREEEGESRQNSKETTNGHHHHHHHHRHLNGRARSMNDARPMDTNKDLCYAIQKGIDEQLPEIPDLLDDDDDEGDEEEDNDNSNNDVKVEEGEGTVKDDEGEEEHLPPETPPMALRIGEGGYIGTLDVRLVGRELHVLVEDAFLCLEAVRKEASPDETGSSPKDSAHDADKQTTEQTQGENPEKQPAPPSTPTASPADINELKTTGERVLAKNSLARIFSSIPHLFLRDITVRLIVRGDNNNNREDDNERSNSQEETTDNNTDPADNDSCGSPDVIVDIGIGLLSVTEGDEFISPFNEDPDAEDASSQEGEADEDQNPPPPLTAQTSQAGGTSPENEYLQRRIRTGKGADGGLWLNVVIPKHEGSSNYPFPNNSHVTVSHAMEHRWARYMWLDATRNCVLRLSGIDIHARIFLGTKKELAQANGSYLWSYDDVSTYDGIDHTLYGFDHVVPGPTPNTLPPLAPAPHCSASRSMDEGDDFGNLRSQIYKTDRNGIQSSQIESCFYRVARGMTPTRCTLEHLPCENCLKCWEASGKRTAEPAPEEAHFLDSYTPMPGLALSVSIRDPLEMNVDRVSLEGLGLVIGLFKKKPEASDAAVGEGQADAEREEEKDIPPVAEVVAEPEPSRGYFSYFFGSSQAEEGDTSRRRFSGLLSPRRTKPKPPAFPSYMKPENVELLGVFIAETRLRVHVMREDNEQRHNTGLSFCYWDLKGDCLTLDQQKLSSEKKAFSDLRLDLGLLELKEFKGTNKKILVSAGVPVPAATSEVSSLESLTSQGRGARPPWPTIASALLDVPATLESMVYENRERHGVQLRMLSVTDQPETDSEKIRTLINCQLGVLELNLPAKIGSVIGEIKGEALKSLGKKPVGDAPTEEVDPAEAEKKDKVTQYRAQLGGGRVRLMSPLIDVRLPLTRLAGNICPKSGFSMETLLERVELSYGQSSQRVVPTANSAKGVSLKRVGSLPEPIRLRILLFLDDLTPLETALRIKCQSNSFLRCNAVNKGLGKMAATKRPKKKAAEASHDNGSNNRRQELMNKLLTLDDDALESLWASHQRKQKRVKKTSSHTKKSRPSLKEF